MNRRTLAALKGSIKKWKKIVAGTGGDNGYDDCPLCALFMIDRSNPGPTCKGCPVAAQAGQGGCRGTPYELWSKLFSVLVRPWHAKTKVKKAAARKELAFLKSLLPKAKVGQAT